MANAIQRKYDAASAFTITLASLASSAAGVGRQSTIVANSNNRPGAIINVKLESNGSAPTAGATYQVYLIQSDGTTRSDGAGASDAAWTRENAQLLGTIVVTASTNKFFYGSFDTALVTSALGTEFGIGIVNASGQALHATEGNHLHTYQTYYDEVQ